MNELQRTFSSLFLSPLQITAALPNNFLHKPKRGLCLQKFLFEKTLSDLLHNYNLISHRQKRGKKRRQSKNKSPSPNIFKQVALLLFAQKRAFHWNIFYVASFAPSFFILFYIFWDIWHQSRRAGLALQLCFEPLPSSDYPTPPSFFVRVCLFFVNAIGIKSLLNAFFFLGGGRKAKRRFPGGRPTAARLWHRGSPRYPPRKLIQSIKNLESGAFLHVFVH